MSKSLKIIIWCITSVVIIGVIFYTISYIVFFNSFGKNFVGEKDPKYLEYVSDRINFGTVRCDNLLQWDTIQYRINNYFNKNPQMVPPDSLGIEVMSCNGCAVIQKSIYFDNGLTEIYIVNFDMASFNYIDDIFQVKNGQLINIKTTTLDNEEKERVRNRLQNEMLDKINWNIDGIKF